MDARNIRGTLIRMSWMVGFVMIAGFMMMAVVRHDSSARRGESNFVRGNECPEGQSKRYVPPNEEDVRDYLHIVNGIVAAYSNCQENIMVELSARFPKSVYDLRGDDHRRVILPLNQAWIREWLRNDDLKEFTSVEDFDRAMRTAITLSRIYGNYIVDSGLTADNVLVSIECKTLERLQKYKDKFTKEKKKDYLLANERFLSEWIGQIDSEKGFTHTYVKRQNRGLAYWVKKGELTSEGLKRHVRGCVYPLEKFCNYTPKWLDKEFPLSSK